MRGDQILLDAIVCAAAVAVVTAPAHPIDQTYGLLDMNAWHGAAVPADGTGVVVGVVDTGLSAAHPAFAAPCVIASVAEPPYKSFYAHGTHVTGIAVGRGVADPPGGPYVGMAPDARVRNGSFGAAIAVTRAMTGLALANRATIVNHSYAYRPAARPAVWAVYPRDGSHADSRALDEIASSRDVLHVIGAGNEGRLALAWQHTPNVPGDHYNGLTVGAVTNAKGTTKYQSFGRAFVGAADERQLVHLQSYGGPGGPAPGPVTLRNIRAAHGVMYPGASPGGDRTWHDPPGDSPNAGWDIVEMAGTSMAAPHVTGVAACVEDYGRQHDGIANPALIREPAHPVADAYDHKVLKAVLMTGCDKPGDWAIGRSIAGPPFVAKEPFDEARGTGVLDAGAAFEIYRNGERDPGPIPADPAWDIHGIAPGASHYYAMTAPVTGYVFATLCWDREWDDAQGDFRPLEDLDLELYVFGGAVPAPPWPVGALAYASHSDVDNAEHVLSHVAGQFVGLHVINRGATPYEVEYALAWTTDGGWGVPYEPAPDIVGWTDPMPDPQDWDHDGVLNDDDNCAWRGNPDQADADGDGLGDVCEAACASDLNGDLVVGFADLILLLSTWGPCAPCVADVDGDGMVSFGDLLLILGDWGPC